MCRENPRQMAGIPLYPVKVAWEFWTNGLVRICLELFGIEFACLLKIEKCAMLAVFDEHERTL